MKKRLLLLAGLLPTILAAAPPQVTNVTASQQADTKFVNVSYTLVLDGGQTAFVELWFSHDNGLTYPIACTSVSGDVNASVSAGSKSAVWNAEEDWDHQFTANGKIRVIATYGDEPSGFAGGGGGDGSGGSGSGSGDSSLVTVSWVSHKTPMEVAPGFFNWTDYTSMVVESYADRGLILALIKMDPTEVTNAKWNEVANWALNNGYTELPLAPGSADADKPMTGMTYWQAIKWCNARSEMDGHEPAYYVDANETIFGDINGDGQITYGTDLFETEDPFTMQDTNGNGQWDEGEPYTDQNFNGQFDPQEFYDSNGNGQHDVGLQIAFRTGTIISDYETGVNIKWPADGYRLPEAEIWKKMATGGANEKMWPWGDDVPNVGLVTSTILADLDPETVDGLESTEPTSADGRQANGFDLKDLIGNVAEWGEYISTYDDGFGNTTQNAEVMGGSYLGLDRADAGTWDSNAGTYVRLFNPSGGSGGGGPYTLPGSLFELVLQGAPSASSSAVGLRCVRYK